MSIVAEPLVNVIGEHDIKTVWDVVVDALNPITEAVRRDDELDWIGVTR